MMNKQIFNQFLNKLAYDLNRLHEAKYVANKILKHQQSLVSDKRCYESKIDGTRSFESKATLLQAVQERIMAGRKIKSMATKKRKFSATKRKKALEKKSRVQI